MPFFSFSLNNNNPLLKDFNIKPKEVYFSKNTYIWKTLKKEKNDSLLVCKKEVRKKLLKINGKVLFCLPPNIGLGDAIEYAKAIKSIKENNILEDFGIAFTDNYSFLFKEYFNFKNVFSYIVPEKKIKYYDSLFHFTLEIKSLKNQKYLRSDIEKEIKNYFNISSEFKNIQNYFTNNKIYKISIFPISNSPIRTMPLFILNSLIDYLGKFFSIDIYVDKKSSISNYIIKGVLKKNVTFVDCENTKALVDSIKNIHYGIFMDSGPLHVAKLFNKRGVLIESSVSSELLLSNYNKIFSIKTNFTSSYCKSPCGLTDIFNYKNAFGCYQTLSIKQDEVIQKNLFSNMGNRGVKNNYISFIEKPVGCLNSLNIQNILKHIREDLSL
ncbi:hypothetical protein OAI94_01550 [bacterium]|nr:hypothetical protein [bacterium]